MTAWGFVHVYAHKPRLPSTPEDPIVEFRWDGSSPKLTGKAFFRDGQYADFSDQELMEVLLALSAEKWTDVRGSYLVLQVIVDPSSTVDPEDSIFSITTVSSNAATVGASARPMFDSQEPEEEQTELELDRSIIQDCDILVSNGEVSAEGMFLTLVHELGHCLGLGHPHTNQHSIMSYARTSRASDLSLDDQAGAIFLYPEEDMVVTENLGCGTLGNWGHSYWFYIVLFLPILFWRLT